MHAKHRIAHESNVKMKALTGRVEHPPGLSAVFM